jgi:hypothetical protein
MKTVTLGLLLIAICWFAADAAHASDLKVPERVEAGAGLTVPTVGSGEATLYLVGPAGSVKRTVKLGGEVRIVPEELQIAGRYLLILRSGDSQSSAAFWVAPAQAARMSFIARPSRLPVAVNNGVSGVVYPFDKFHNLIVQPQAVTFKFSVAGAAEQTRTVTTRNGVAWISLDSSRKEGRAEFVAKVGDVTERRVVQEVASDPCNLRIHAQPSKQGVEIATDPIRDCSGNPVPDGTIVTFTAISPAGKSSVDARIKKGIAKADLPGLHNATISVASGVVMGNEIRWGGGQ